MKPKKIGRYELISELGRGGMSTVYLARDPRFERDVAVKLLPREFLHDPTFKIRFEREAKTIASLEHSSIVPVYDFGEEEGQPFLVMRFMTGGSLVKKLDHGPLNVGEISRIISRVATALDEAHNRRMIHRDIKPGNILFDQYGEAYLSDFGIVKLTQETTTFTGSGIIGTPAYMSPEQARGDREIDQRSDVYALGAILFEMLAGQPPYEADTPMGLAVKHITEPVPKLSEFRSDLPPDFEVLIECALAKDPEDRFASAGELAAALTEIVAAEVEPPLYEIRPSPEMPSAEGEVEPAMMEPLAFDQEIEAPAAIPEISPPRTPEPEAYDQEIQAPAEVAEILPPKIKKPRRKVPIWGWVGGGVIVVGLVFAVLFAGKGIFPTAMVADTNTPTVTLIPRPEKTSTPQPIPTETLPAVIGPNPSPLVGVFYYPWYGNPAVDGQWVHWEETDFNPPLDISSDYYPLLGAYSSFDPIVAAHHCAWLRQAGVGVLISSWWGQGSREDQAIPVLLEVAETYGVKIAFHIEPYLGRSANKLVDDIKYIYRKYGDHPAFFRTTAASRWNPDSRRKGLFFVWLINQPDTDSEPVEADYWQEAMETIHDLPDGGLVIANTTDASWIDGGHFDGLYNYATLHLYEGDYFNWAKSLPPDAWYVPSVIPGFSARRIGYSDDTFVPRKEGLTFENQWQAALETGVEPQMVVITSFNEWHEGTQIEPAALGANNDQGYTYMDYEGLGSEGYLEITWNWVNQYINLTWPPTYRARIQMTTTSDWTVFKLVSGAAWARPAIISVSETADGPAVAGDSIDFGQPISRAEVGSKVEVVMDILFTKIDPEGTLVFQIERGHIGLTEVKLSSYVGPEPVLVETFRWGGIVAGERNAATFQIPASKLISPSP